MGMLGGEIKCCFIKTWSLKTIRINGMDFKYSRYEAPFRPLAERTAMARRLTPKDVERLDALNSLLSATDKIGIVFSELIGDFDQEVDALAETASSLAAGASSATVAIGAEMTR